MILINDIISGNGLVPTSTKPLPVNIDQVPLCQNITFTDIEQVPYDYTRDQCVNLSMSMFTE